MVGVPGRSKACITCRKRRKRCDLDRPACTQCKRAGLACQGYDSQLTFVVGTPTNPSTSYRAPNPQPTQSALWDRINRNQVASSITNSNLLARPEDEQRCIHLFWEAYFPSGKPIPPAAARSYTCTWTETALKTYREDDALRYALWANCLLLTGKRQGPEWMTRQARQAYGRALTELRRVLGTSQGTRGQTVIATVKLLSMFEAFVQEEGREQDEPTDWQRHHAGELALIVARKPAAHSSGDAHYIFADERVEMALSALLQRKRLLLDTPEWKTIPWQEVPKDLKDILVDVLVDMPRLVEDFDNMNLSTDLSKRAILRLKLEQECWEHDQQLLNWLGTLQKMIGPAGPPKGAGPKDTVTHIAQVHGMSLYWVTSLVLYSVLHAVSESTNDLPARTDPTPYAHRLVDAVSILLQPDAGLYGRQSAALLLELALAFVPFVEALQEDRKFLMDRLRSLKQDWANGPGRKTSTALYDPAPRPTTPCRR